MSQNDVKDDNNNQEDPATIEPGSAEEAEALGVEEENTPVSEETSEEEVSAEDVAIPGAEDYVEESSSKVELPDFKAGDTVKVHYKIIEGNKTRIQPFEGIVIARKGKDVSRTFTVRKIGAGNIGVERIFPLYSPNITKFELVKEGSVRRSKLYYLRDKIGKAASKVKEKKTS